MEPQATGGFVQLARLVTGAPVSDLDIRERCGVSARVCSSSGGGSLPVLPQTCRGGPVLAAPIPHHSGTEKPKKGGPLWLQLQGYVEPMTFRQDHLPVLTTAVLVTTRTGFPLQLRSPISTSGDVLTAGDETT